ncbi:MAG: 4Fe-4S dicluster domain-containing protein [Planctomycetia bacterium]|nr:4Fe-4S dicluster domain-containing protein [Planctomycetia bacterium]
MPTRASLKVVSALLRVIVVFAVLVGVTSPCVPLARGVCRLSPLLFVNSLFSGMTDETLPVERATESVPSTSPSDTTTALSTATPQGQEDNEPKATNDATPPETFGVDALGRYGAFLSFAILALCCFNRRFFCRRVCPIGACVDVYALARRRVMPGRSRFLRFGWVLNGTTRRFFFWFFLILWTLATLASLFASHNATIALFGETFSPVVFDPMSMTARVFLLIKTKKILAIAPTALALCCLVWPYFWRFSLCPCGTLQEILYIPWRLCRRALRRPSPDNSHVATEQLHKRRAFLNILGATVLTSLFGATFLSRAKGAALRIFLPPSKRPVEDFLARCAHCGLCVRTCPTQILDLVNLSKSKPDSDANASPSNALTLLEDASLNGAPYLSYDRGLGYCEKDCSACGEVCPTGALMPMTPIEKAQRPIALAVFDLEKCKIYYQQECHICRHECPYDAIDFIWSDEEYAYLPTINSDQCAGCGRCVVACPGVTDDSAECVEAESGSQGATGAPKALTMSPRV